MRIAIYSFGLASLTSKVFLHDIYNSNWNNSLADNTDNQVSFLEISSNDFNLNFVTQTIHKSRTVIARNNSLYAHGDNFLEIFTGTNKSDDKTLAAIDLSIASAEDGYSHIVRNMFSPANKTVDIWRLIWLMIRS